MNVFVSDGIHLAYRIDGLDNAPAIVLVNSLGTDLRMWESQIAILSHRLRVVRFDCRGHGNSEVSYRSYTIEQLGLDLLALLDTLQIERAHLCGLSLGGIVALWVASEHPERVVSATFANTAARIGTKEIWETRIDAVRRGGMGAVRDTILARFLSAKFRQRYPQATQQIGEMIELTNPEGYIGACICLRDTDLHQKLSAIHVPSLILTGELDESTPVWQAQELHTAITGSDLVIIQEAAHLSNIEKTEKFNEALLTFLEQIKPSWSDNH